MMKFIKQHINTILLVAILFIVNIIGNFYFKRFDLTEEKRYSISTPTKQFLQNLDDIVTVNVYLTGNLPSGMKELEKNINTTLSEFKAYAGNNLEYNFIDLSKFDQKTQIEEGKLLQERGLFPTNLTVVESGEQTQKLIYPGAIISYKGRVLSTTFLENKVGYDQMQIINNSIILIEYKIANAIQKLQQTHPPLIAFTTGHGEVPQEQLTEIITELQANQFAVSIVDLTVGYKIEDIIDVLVIPKPTKAFTEKEKYKIDQYIMRGGKVMWLVDQMQVDMDSLNGASFYMSNARDINIDDMLFKYGARINDDLILDLQNTKIEIQTGVTNNQPQMQLFPWPYFNLMYGNENHPVSRNLAPISAQFSSTIDTIKNNNIKKDILLTSSNNSKAQFAPARVYIGLVKEDLSPKLYQQKALPTAVALNGNFESIFKNRVIQGSFKQMTDTIEELRFLEVSENATKMIVVSDGDLISNHSKRGKQLPIGYGIFGNNNSPMVFDNKAFFMNSIEYLMDKNNLIETRSKVIKLRQLDNATVKKKKKSIQFNNLVTPLIILVLFGFIYSFIRKRKYAKS